MSSRRSTAIWVLSLLLASFLLIGSGQAAAQENPRAEVYLGYALPGGFNGSAAYKLNRWFGIVGDYSYRVAEYYADKPLHTFTAGPRVTLRLIPRIIPFAHVLFGGAGSGCASYSNTSGCQFGASSAMVLGAGLDVKINRTLSIRAIQFDRIRTRFGENANTYTGISMGAAFAIGRIPD